MYAECYVLVGVNGEAICVASVKYSHLLLKDQLEQSNVTQRKWNGFNLMQE